MISALIPIQSALSVTLVESLNTARSSMSGTVVQIQTKALRSTPFVLFGLLSVAIGLVIYICLPNALLTENIPLILEIFLGLLLGMMLGITLMVVNVRYVIEVLLTCLLLFWERKSMR